MYLGDSRRSDDTPVPRLVPLPACTGEPWALACKHGRACFGCPKLLMSPESIVLRNVLRSPALPDIHRRSARQCQLPPSPAAPTCRQVVCEVPHHVHGGGVRRLQPAGARLSPQVAHGAEHRPQRGTRVGVLLGGRQGWTQPGVVVQAQGRGEVGRAGLADLWVSPCQVHANSKD